MTFGISRDQGAFEWAGSSLSAVFAQRSNILKGRVWQMLFDVIRFNQFALDLLSEAPESENDPSGTENDTTTLSSSVVQESIGDYLIREGYSDAFRDDYLIPMTAAVWSTSPDKCSLEFPAVTLVRFLWNHHLLSTISARPTWMTIKEGAQLYIDAIMRDHPKSQMHLSSGVNYLSTTSAGHVELHLSDGSLETFDHVILATHGDQAMEIIRPIATREERAIMSEFKTSVNTAVLHSDLSVCTQRYQMYVFS